MGTYISALLFKFYFLVAEKKKDYVGDEMRYERVDGILALPSIHYLTLSVVDFGFLTAVYSLIFVELCYDLRLYAVGIRR